MVDQFISSKWFTVVFFNCVYSSRSIWAARRVSDMLLIACMTLSRECSTTDLWWNKLHSYWLVFNQNPFLNTLYNILHDHKCEISLQLYSIHLIQQDLGSGYYLSCVECSLNLTNQRFFYAPDELFFLPHIEDNIIFAGIRNYPCPQHELYGYSSSEEVCWISRSSSISSFLQDVHRIFSDN